MSMLAALALAVATGLQPPARERTFEVTYRATVDAIPAGAGALDLWLPLPQDGPDQEVGRLTIDAPGPARIGREAVHGNRMLHLRLGRPTGPVSVGWTALATRREALGVPGPIGAEERARALAAEPLVPLDGPVRALALEATAGLGPADDAGKARAIYEAVVGRMRYDKAGTGWGRGDALYACDARRGNCTDFHALVIGMARSLGIPARFAIGLSIPPDRPEGPVEGYHCWAELYVEGRGWVPVDASEAAKDPARRDYFFGRHDEHRLELSRGRHLRLEPPQAGPPVNFFVEPYAEVDGRPHPSVARSSSFRSVAP